MKIVVTGATGVVGTHLLELLAHEPRVSEIVCISRPPLGRDRGKFRFEAADLTTDPLVKLFDRAEAVVHLAWLGRGVRNVEHLRTANVVGSERVFQAALKAGARTIVHASSLAVYAPGPKLERVKESWPLGAVASSLHARLKVEVERKLDRVERSNRRLRVVRLRPGLVFDDTSVTRLGQAFPDGFFVSFLFGGRRTPFVPDVPGLAFQAVHASDLAEAFGAALLSEARGAFNVAAEPAIDSRVLARALGLRTVAMDARSLRSKLAWGYNLRLQPISPEWLDLAISLPLVDSTRAREELGWTPQVSSVEAMLEAFGRRRDRTSAPAATAPPRGELRAPPTTRTLPQDGVTPSWMIRGASTPRPRGAS